MDLEIVRATKAHANEIGYVHATAWHAAYKGIVPDAYLSGITPAYRAEKFLQLIQIRPEAYYLAYVDRKAAGMLILGKSLDEDVEAETGEIGALYFMPEYWDKGYGKSTMQFAVARLKELGYSHVTIWVFEDNIRARRFYERFGYVPDGARKPVDRGTPLFEVRYQLIIQ